MMSIATTRVMPRLLSSVRAGCIVMCGALLALAAGPTAAQVPDSVNPSLSVFEEPLEPGDAIRLEFWRSPDLNGEFTINHLGVVVLPLLGPRNVTGVPSVELSERLAADFGEQLANQDVQITLLRRVRVLGEVRTPGLYHVDPTMTLGDAVALAGGVTDRGKLSGIKIFRDGAEVRSDLDVRAPIAEQIRSGDQINVPRRSWFALNSGMLVGSLIGAAATIVLWSLR